MGPKDEFTQVGFGGIFCPWVFCWEKFPLVVWGSEGILIDGHHRYKIIRELHIDNFDTVEREFKSRDEAKAWIIRNQFSRRNLTPYQRAELALELEKVFRAKGKENLKLSKGRGKKGCQNSDKVIDTKKELAKVAAVSHDTIAKAKVIKEQADDATKEKLRKGESTINRGVHQDQTQEAGSRK